MEKEDNDDDPYSVSQSRLLYRSCMATGVLAYYNMVITNIIL